MSNWTVRRHGGRHKDTWRVVYSGPDEARARRVYAREHERLRQGAVELRGPDGRVVLSDWGPRIRTRW